MYQITVYVPEESSEQVKEVMFAQGAGRYSGYDCCAWETIGTGQFRPLESSRPYIGVHHAHEKVKELKIQMICSEECIKNVLDAMIEAHPYEVPAYTVIPFFTREDFT